MRRFHDLRHTFGSLVIRRFDLVVVQAMMGHSKTTTTQRYLHSRPRPGDSAKLASIFATEGEDETHGAALGDPGHGKTGSSAEVGCL